MKKVMLFGTFDGLHEGHRFLVREAKKRGRTVVVVGTSAHVRTIKGRMPRRSMEERIADLQSEFPDIKVIQGSEADFLIPLRAEKPDLILLGYDQQLPPGITLEDLSCPWERIEALKPEIYKSSLLTGNTQRVTRKKS